MEKFYCGFCGYPNLVQNKFCNKCGSPLLKINDLAVDPLTDSVPNLNLAANRSERLQKEIFNLIENGGVLLISITTYCIVVYRNFKTSQCYLDLNDDSFYDKIKLEQIYKIGFNLSNGRLLKDFVVTNNEQVSQLIIDDCIYIFDYVFCLPSTELLIYENLEEENIDKDVKETSEKQTVDGNYTLKIIIGVFLILMVGVGYYLVTYGNLFQPSEAKLKEMAYIQAKKDILDSLSVVKDATFDPSERVKISLRDDNTFMVEGYVESKNDLGIWCQTNYMVGLKYLGGDLHEDKNWQKLAFLLWNRNDPKPY